MTIQFPEITGTHFIDFGRMKGCVITYSILFFFPLPSVSDFLPFKQTCLKLSPRMSFWKKICLSKKNWKNITLCPRSWNYCKHYRPNQSKFNDVNSKNTFCSSLYDSTRKFKHIILNNTTCKVFQHHPLPCKVLR